MLWANKISVNLLVSISPTFYAQLFCTKVLRKAFLSLDLRFVLFWRKTIGAKAARNELVKLTPADWQLLLPYILMKLSRSALRFKDLDKLNLVKFVSGVLVLGSGQILILPKLTQKIMLTLKVVISDSKINVLLTKPKFETHSAEQGKMVRPK
jgi:hypothetical protein